MVERGLKTNSKPLERLRTYIIEQYRADTKARRAETEKKKAK
jgi:hypothetical protein